MRVVICGGGVIGACIAYYLACRGVHVVVVERAEVANAASGKAGGFLALDWCTGSPLDALARRSFGLHSCLQDEIEGDWGYRRMNAYSGLVVADDDTRRQRPGKLDWLSEGVIVASRLGTPETTAIVNPRSFTSAIMAAARKHGAELRHERVTGVLVQGTASRVNGVETDGGKIEADAVVVAMGPWSLLAAKWLRIPPVFAQKSPSLVYNTGTDIPADALFLEYQEESGLVTVEVFPRADGSTHVTALSEDEPLPVDPLNVTPEPEKIARLEAIGERLSPAFTRQRIVARQACFRPIAEDGLPLIGKVPQIDHAYIATAHNVWGILNAPATGEAMAELIVDGAASSVDLTPFDPVRFRPLDPASLRT